jgi:hypothetical protein
MSLNLLGQDSLITRSRNVSWRERNRADRV